MKRWVGNSPDGYPDSPPEEEVPYVFCSECGWTGYEDACDEQECDGDCCCVCPNCRNKTEQYDSNDYYDYDNDPSSDVDYSYDWWVE